MNLEDRLRAELERSGRTTKVGVAPTIDDLSSVAAGRRQRNRNLGTGAVAVAAVALGLGAFVLNLDNTSTVDLADAPTEAVQEAADQTAMVEDEGTKEAAVTAEDAAEAGAVDEPEVVENEFGTDPLVVSPPVDPTGDDNPDNTSTDAGNNQAAPDDFAQGAAPLQVDDGVIAVEKRESAVGLASGSGVLVLNDGADGYVGLAVSFGESTVPLSLSSPNGLDWTGIELVGVPEGATASVLREYDGTFVALFERLNAGSKEVSIGTSIDMVVWEVSAPLAGGEVYATDLAVGSPGVIVIGDNESPQVWSGPIGGPYERTAVLEARALNGVTTVAGQFVVAGRSDQGVALFTSTNAVTWSTTNVGSQDGATISANAGTITMRNVEDSTTLISSDAGTTWTALPAGSSRGVTVSNSTMGFLGGDASGAVVAIGDGEDFSTADLDISAPDRLSLVAAGNDEIVMVQTTEAGTTWIVAGR